MSPAFFIWVLILAFHVGSAQPIEGVDYVNILRSGVSYSERWHSELPPFTYQSSNHSQLAALRANYKLDSIAGFGNEESRILNLLHWVHNTIRHEGQKESGINEVNAAAILSAVQQKGVGVSCGELATVLNECYLAMGWVSRKIYCIPLDSTKTDQDSHVINAVFLSSKKNGYGLTQHMMPMLWMKMEFY
jgi:hypothetical protein